MIFGFGFSAESNGPITDKALAYTFLLTGIASGALGWWLRQRPARVVVKQWTE